MVKTIPKNKQIWAAHCDSNYVPLYFRPWWMDCVCGVENWDVCLSLDGSGKVEGALLYFMSRYWGLKVIKMPPLTAYSGLWLNCPPNLELNSSRLDFEKRNLKFLISQLPSFSFFFQQWHPNFENWLPLFWEKFHQTTLYTYFIDMTVGIDLLKRSLKSSLRNHINNASKKVQVIESHNPTILFNLYALSLKRQNKKPAFSIEFFQSLDNELVKRDKRLILIAEDEMGNVHAAIYLTWDEKNCYFLLSGRRPEFDWSNAMSLLLWTAIIDNPGNSQTFDFEGAMLEPVERYFRAFGGRLVPHFKITRTPNKWLRILGLALNKNI